MTATNTPPLAPHEHIPVASIPTWLAFEHREKGKKDSTCHLLRVLIALHAYGAAQDWIPRKVTAWAKDLHVARTTVYRMLERLVRAGVVRQRRTKTRYGYRIDYHIVALEPPQRERTLS